MANDIEQPKPVAQMLITLLDNNTCSVQHTSPDAIQMRGMLDMARFILDWQAMQAMQAPQQSAPLVIAPNGVRLPRVPPI